MDILIKHLKKNNRDLKKRLNEVDRLNDRLEDEIRELEWSVDELNDEVSDLERKVWDLEDKVKEQGGEIKLESPIVMSYLHENIREKINKIGAVKLNELIE